jgi:hypothetical protein
MLFTERNYEKYSNSTIRGLLSENSDFLYNIYVGGGSISKISAQKNGGKV